MISGMVLIMLHHLRKQRFNQSESISIQTNCFQLTFAADVDDLPEEFNFLGIGLYLMYL